MTCRSTRQTSRSTRQPRNNGSIRGPWSGRPVRGGTLKLAEFVAVPHTERAR
jgi:hypothetical protein